MARMGDRFGILSKTLHRHVFLYISLLFSCQSGKAVAIVQRFPFSSALQRMSVVTVASGGHSVLAFIKGSPEMVASLCRAETGK